MSRSQTSRFSCSNRNRNNTLTYTNNSRIHKDFIALRDALKKEPTSASKLLWSSWVDNFANKIGNIQHLITRSNIYKSLKGTVGFKAWGNAQLVDPYYDYQQKDDWIKDCISKIVKHCKNNANSNRDKRKSIDASQVLGNITKHSANKPIINKKKKKKKKQKIPKPLMTKEKILSMNREDIEEVGGGRYLLVNAAIHYVYDALTDKQCDPIPLQIVATNSTINAVGTLLFSEVWKGRCSPTDCWTRYCEEGSCRIFVDKDIKKHFTKLLQDVDKETVTDYLRLLLDSGDESDEDYNDYNEYNCDYGVDNMDHLDGSERNNHHLSYKPQSGPSHDEDYNEYNCDDGVDCMDHLNGWKRNNNHHLSYKPQRGQSQSSRSYRYEPYRRAKSV